jgi:hypothetical protein
LKNPLYALYRIAAFSSNIGRGLLSTKLTGGDFLKDSLFELIGDFRLFTGARSINKVAVCYGTGRKRQVAAVNGRQL